MSKLIIGNWKCNPTSLKEAKAIFNSIKIGSKNIKNAEIIIAPPFVFLSEIKKIVGNLKLAGQNCFYQEKGAFTGEISIKMLKDAGAAYVIVGHSERRRIFNETDEMINEKLKAVLKENLMPIFCVGETKQEKDNNLTFQVLEKQLTLGLKNIPANKISKLVIAYEPVWAIGTGQACSADNALTMILFIRKIIAKLFNLKIAKNIKIIYGGSVNSENAGDYLKEKEINGLLPGGASLIPQEFLKIAKK